MEDIAVTSTDYVLHFERVDGDVRLRAGRQAARLPQPSFETTMSLHDIVRQVESAGRLLLVAILAENPGLEGNWSIKEIRSVFRSLAGIVTHPPSD